MKKILCLVLCLLVALCFASCGQTNDTEKCTNHVDANADGKCDTCQAAVEGNQNTEHTSHVDEDKNGVCDDCDTVCVDYSDTELVAGLLKDALDEQIDKVNSLKVELDIDVTQYSKYWYEDYDTGAVVSDETNTNATANIVALISKTDNGFNAKLDVTLSQSYDGGKTEYSETQTAYIIDGYGYVEVADGLYTKSSVVPAELTEAMEQIAEFGGISEVDKDTLMETFATELTALLSIEEGKGSMSFDAKPAIDEILGYINGIDGDKDTVKGLINDAFAAVGAEIDIEAVVDELERIAGLTVNEALAELDTFLVANSGANLQQLYNSIIADSQIKEIIKNAIIATDAIPGYDETNPEHVAAIEQIMAQLAAVNFAALIEENQIGDVVLYDYIIALAGMDPTAEETPNKAMFFAGVRLVLNSTISELEEMMEVQILPELQSIDVKVNKLDGKLDVDFDELLTLNGMNGELNVDVAVAAPSYYEGKTDINNLKIAATIKVYELSESEATIALPSGAVAVDDELVNGTFYLSSEEGEVSMYLDTYGDEPVVYIDVEYYDYDIDYYVNVSAWDIPLEAVLEDTVVIEEFYISLYNPAVYSEPYVTVAEDAVLKLQFDVENGVCNIVEMPEFTFENENADDYYVTVE